MIPRPPSRLPRGPAAHRARQRPRSMTMRSASELQLPHLPLTDPAFAADPLPYIESARQQHPWLAVCDMGYVVHEYQAIRDLTLMDTKFNPSLDAIIELMGAKGTPWGDFMLNLMLAKDPPEHTRLRSS